MNRVLHISGLCWLFTVLAALRLGEQTASFFAFVAAGLLLGAAILKIKVPSWLAGALTAICLACVSITVYFQGFILPGSQYNGTTQTIEGVVLEKNRYPTYSSFVVRCGESGVPAGLEEKRIRGICFTGLDVEIGDVVKCKIDLKCEKSRRNSLYSRGISYEGILSGPIERTGEKVQNLQVQLFRYRSRLYSNLTSVLSGEEGEILAAMILGETEGISTALRTQYSRAGIAHLMAVSGLHLSILTGVVNAVLAALRISRRKRSMIGILFVALFMGLAGFSYSVTRAGIMMILVLCAGLFGRDTDTLTSLGAAVILILLGNPYSAYNIGLLLSYLATMSIAVFSSPMFDWLCNHLVSKPPQKIFLSHKVMYALLQTVSVTISASILTMPLVAYLFGQISLIAPLVNLILSPIIPVALFCGLLCGACSFVPFLLVLTRILGLISGGAVKVINLTAKFFADLPFAAVGATEGYLIIWLTAVVLGGTLLIVNKAGTKVKKFAAMLSLTVLLAGMLSYSVAFANPIRLIAPKYSSCIALTYNGRAVVLGEPSAPQEAEDMVSFFEANGVKQIQLLILQKEEEYFSSGTNVLKENFPIAGSIAVEQVHGFTAKVLNNVIIEIPKEDNKTATIRIGGYQIVKLWKDVPRPADIMLNSKNEIILGKRAHNVNVNDRYYGSNVIAFKAIDE